MTTVRQNLPQPISATIISAADANKRPRDSTFEFVVLPANLAKRQHIVSVPAQGALNSPTPQAQVAVQVQAVAPALDPSALPMLGQDALQALRAAQIEVPEYDRASLKQGIVHIGVGNFFSAHLADYLHKLLNLGEGSDWGILGVGLTASSAGKAQKILAQDCLHTLVERGPDGEKPRVIGAMTGYLAASADPQALITKLADESTRIVSMTLTGSGYYVNEVTKQLDLQHPDIAHDLQNPEAPKTAYGYLTRALARRKDAGLPPFTVLSCDNLPQNGERTRDMLVSFIAQTNPELALWVRDNGGFPNTMVDRITPATTQKDLDALAKNFGIRDARAVFTEPFTQFVVEDKFSAGRPALEKVGVQFVADVEPFAQMKQRLLNANHSAIAYKGVLAGYTFVHEAVGNATFAAYVRMLMDSELPVLPQVPGTNLEAYCDALMERFHNPALGDEVLRLCRRGSEKIPKFILASIRDRITGGADIQLSSLIVAAFIRYLAGVDEKGQPFKIEDPRAADLVPLAKATGIDTHAFLRQSGIVGDDLLANDAFLRSVKKAFIRLNVVGADKALGFYLAQAQAQSSKALAA